MKVSDFVHEMHETSAIFGRKHDINVVFEGDRAGTNGDTIYLPSMDMEASLTQDQIMTMRGYVDHEAGHIRHSNMPRIMDFYDRNSSNSRQSLSELHNALEDVWMEGKVSEEYPGSYKNLKHLHEMVKKKEVQSFVDGGAEDKLKEVNIASIGGGIVAHNPNYAATEESYTQKFRDMLTDEMNEWTEMWSKQAFEAKDSDELITLAKSIWKLLEEDPDLSQSKPEDFDPESGKDMDEGEISDEVRKARQAQKGEGEGKPVKLEKGDGDPLQADDLPDDYMPEMGELVEDAQESEEGVGGIGNPNGPLKSRGYRVYSTAKDEVYKRGKTGQYTKRYDKIVNSNDHVLYKEVKGGISSVINVMKAKLRRALLAKQRRDWDFGKEKGRLDTKRLVKAYNRIPTVYKERSDRIEEDTAITILIDLSGSMSGTKVRVARDCAVAISECLDGSAMPFKVVGFCNTRMANDDRWDRHNSGGMYHRYDALDTVVFKDYSETLRKSQGSVANIHQASGGCNSDYDFIKQELYELAKRPEARKVLFVLSDGYPANSTDANRDELMKHCRSAIKQGQKDGVECVGIGICSDAVKKIYDNNVVVNDVQDLGTTVFSKLTQLLVGGIK